MSETESESETRAKRPRRLLTWGPLSARSNPAWLNQATVKGSVLILAGTAMTVATRDSDRHVAPILGWLLIAWSLSELWFRVVRRAAAHDLAGLAFPFALLVGGIVLVVNPGPALSIIPGMALVARSVVLLWRHLRTGNTPRRHVPLMQIAILFLVGAVMIALPESLVLGVRALIGGLAVVIGGILLARGLGPENREEILALDVRGAGTLTRDWLRDQRLDATRVQEISATVFFEQPRRGPKLASFWVMMCLATAIATFAVIQDSTAVVIGAMLVAPLMTPIVGIAAGLVNGQVGRLLSSLILVIAAVVVAVFIAWIIAAWLPSVGDLANNSQITSRVEPNMLDLCIAVAAGAAGAYATVDPRVSSSLSGVAIAVALVPPLAVVGVTLEAGLTGDAMGAFLLFTTNLVSIIVAGSIVLILTGFARLSFRKEDRERQWRVVGPVLLGMVLVIVPLSITSVDIWQSSNDQATAERVINAWLPKDRDLNQVSLDVSGNTVNLVLTGSDTAPDVDELQRELNAALDEKVTLVVRVVPSKLLSS